MMDKVQKYVTSMDAISIFSGGGGGGGGGGDCSHKVMFFF
jgi:hypothetical protein